MEFTVWWPYAKIFEVSLCYKYHGFHDPQYCYSRGWWCFMWAVGLPLLRCSVTICNFIWWQLVLFKLCFSWEIIKQGTSNHPGCSKGSPILPSNILPFLGYSGSNIRGFTVCLLASYCIVSSVDVCLELCMCPVICRSVKLLPGIGLSAKNDCWHICKPKILRLEWSYFRRH